ncbi:MAG: hypothetical protein ACLPY5_09705 [Candidatus Bathyarchaeia archaeon]
MTESPLADIVEETRRLVESADKRGITLRLFGGMAIRFHCPSATHRALERKYADVDFIALRKQSREIKKFFLEMGYAPRVAFNAMSGDKRLIFNDIERRRRVDIFLDIFEMCHRFDFRNRLNLDNPTIPLADLLATKLQVVEISEREYRDIIALMYDHEVGDTDAPETINGSYLAHLCTDDWGLYKTLTINISNILIALDEYALDPEVKETVHKRLDALRSRIENAPKSMGWRMRAKIGEKKQWYQLPEKDKEVIDSRRYGERAKTQ